MSIAFGPLGLLAALAVIVRPPARHECALPGRTNSKHSNRVNAFAENFLEAAAHPHIIRKPSSSQTKIVTHANAKMAPREMTAIGHRYPGAIFAVLVADMFMASLHFLPPLFNRLPLSRSADVICGTIFRFSDIRPSFSLWPACRLR